MKLFNILGGSSENQIDGVYSGDDEVDAINNAFDINDRDARVTHYSLVDDPKDFWNGAYIDTNGMPCTVREFDGNDR